MIFDMKKELIYTSKKGNAIPISLYSKEAFGMQDCILYIHGFKGFKDWGFVPFLGEYFAERDMTFLAFNFSHNGIKGHAQEFTEFDKFRDNTFSLEVEEAKEVIRLCREGGVLGTGLKGKLGVLGHSRGGGIAILAANNNPDVDVLTTWASVSTFNRFEKSVKQHWKSKGYHEVKNSRTGQVFKMGKSALDDLEKNSRSSLNILDAVRELEVPYLIIHGQNDETVPSYEGEQLNIFANPQKASFRMVPEGSHTFGATHPFTTPSPSLQEALEVSYEFFVTNFQYEGE